MSRPVDGLFHVTAALAAVGALGAVLGRGLRAVPATVVGALLPAVLPHDGRRMRRHQRRFVIGRTLARLHSYRRLLARHEY